MTQSGCGVAGRVVHAGDHAAPGEGRVLLQPRQLLQQDGRDAEGTHPPSIAACPSRRCGATLFPCAPGSCPLQNTRSDGAGAESPLSPFLQALLDYSMAIRIDSKTAVSRLSLPLPLTRTTVPISAPPAAPSVVKPRRRPHPSQAFYEHRGMCYKKLGNFEVPLFLICGATASPPVLIGHAAFLPPY
jgi:hypothetical protein